MPVSEKFLTERRTAIGGSDTPSLLNMPPFGCKRRLWYDKKGLEADFPFLGSRHTKRGDVLESIASYEYELMTLRFTQRVEWKLMEGHPYVGAHADRLQRSTLDNQDKLGVLEVKIPSARYYYPLPRVGDPPIDALAQLQWVMMAWGATWGTVWVWSPDAWDGKKFDVDADAKMQKDLLDLGRDFWNADLPLSDNPCQKLPEGDRRCLSCTYRKTCKGLDYDSDPMDEITELVPEAARIEVPDHMAVEMMADYLAAQKMMKDAKAAKETAAERIKALFPGQGLIECSQGTISLRTVKRRAYTADVKETTYDAIRVTPKYERYDDNGDGE